jgi:hypothetical protein
MCGAQAGAASGADVLRDLEENRGWPISKLLVQELGAYVSVVVQVRELNWTYATPPVEAEIRGRGYWHRWCTCVLIGAVARSIWLYDRSGGEAAHDLCRRSAGTWQSGLSR